MKYEHMNEKDMVECRHENRREEAWCIPGKMKKSQNCLQEGKGQEEEREKMEPEGPGHYAFTNGSNQAAP